MVSFSSVSKGKKQLFTSPDQDDVRAFFKRKSRALISNIMTADEAVTAFIAVINTTLPFTKMQDFNLKSLQCDK